MKSFIKGIFTKFIFKSDKNYIIGLIRIQDTNDEEMVGFINKTITFTGYFHELSVDEKYIFYGSLVDNQKYGLQYSVEEYERVKPEGKDSIIEFLSSNIFDKVGEKTAKKIVEVLGEDTLKLIEEDYTNLLLVPNIKEDKAKKIHETLLKYNESYDIIVYLTNIGFSIKDSMNIYNKLKENTYKIINNNIYELIDLVDEITFSKIEKIRKNLNIEDNNKNRILYSILYVFKNYCFNTGDTYVNKEDLLDDVIRTLNLDDFTLSDLTLYLYELNMTGKVIIKNDKYFLTEYYKAENIIADIVCYLTNKKDSKYKHLMNEIESMEIDFEVYYNEKQKEAIKNSMIKNFNIITGGPGTGKTTIIKAVVELYKRINRYSYIDLTQKMALLAPTGRAAKRMSESTLFPACTIHRFLKWNRETDKFMINNDNKSNVDFVIVDEASMIDVNLFSNLLLGLKKDVKLVLIGDSNQLESVGPGKVLKDLIDSEMINVIKLDELYRQNENSYIASLAKEINEGYLTYDFKRKKNDFNFIECNSHNVKEYIKEVTAKALEKGYNSKEIQILAPMYKGENGIDNLNVTLQEIFNKKEEGLLKYGDVIYKVNDKVLQLENDPDNNVFNGDIGYIRDIKDKVLTIDFDGNIVKYQTKNLNMIKHAYAISIHKSQGSEFKIVIMPVVPSYKIMLYKKLIYTGITRAKQSLILIGDKESFIYAINNLNSYNRRTILKEILLEGINN